MANGAKRRASDCGACGGTGTYSQRTPLVTINSTCGTCEGKGIIVDEMTKCKCCHRGRVHQTKEVRVEVPAGVTKDMRKLYEGEGDVGEYGGLPGDLIIIFDVEDSPLFLREGDDAICNVNISFFQAALGAQLAVPGLDGCMLRLDIPAGTQPHEVLRIDGEGFINATTLNRGHLYVRAVLDIPKTLSPRQIEILSQAQREWTALPVSDHHQSDDVMTSGDSSTSGCDEDVSSDDAVAVEPSLPTNITSSNLEHSSSCF